jgi:HEAT repeat protein/PBS lyase HEAT-like repeat-containing protein
VSELQDLLADLTSGDETRAEGAVHALVEYGTDAIPALLDLTHASYADTRWWALRTLAQSPQLQTEWLIPLLLNDPALEVRQCAALGLTIKPDETAIQPLVQALSDADSMTSHLAMNALIKAGKDAVPALIESVKKKDSQSARIMALRALAEIRDHRAIPVMMQVMEEDSVLLQHWAQEGLERLGLDMVYIKPV